MDETQHPIVVEFMQFAAEFRSETDRAAVILGAAKLDILLYQILQRFLIAESSSTDELLEADGPLSTFSARIKIVYRLGLIDRDLARALHLIRRIRNSFAHELSGVKLASGAHRDRIRELAAPFKAMPDWEKLHLHTLFKDCGDAGAEFRSVVAMLAFRLGSLLRDLKPLDDHQTFRMIPESFMKAGYLIGTEDK